MAITKKYSRDKKRCIVTFTLPSGIDLPFEQASVVGEFNNWEPDVNLFAKNKNKDSFSVDVELDAGKEYRFRYWLHGVSWINDPEADRYEPTPFGDAENCVIII